MVDTSTINLLDLIEGNFKRVASTQGGEYAGPCPWCGGVDRFRIQPHKETPSYWCRQCNRSGDAITYIQDRAGIPFSDALERLRLDEPIATRSAPRPRPSTMHLNISLESDPWQDRARRFVNWASEQMTTEQFDYLQSRGISAATATGAGIGYNPEAIRDPQWPHPDDTKTIYLSDGIVIPSILNGQIWSIKVRRSDGRYLHVAGSTNGLFLSRLIEPGCTVVMVEAELDALTVRSSTPDVVPVATGSTSGCRSSKWMMRLALAQRVLLAFDADKAGDDAAAYWQGRLGRKARRLRPEGAKDPGDMYRLGYSITDWIQSA